MADKEATVYIVDVGKSMGRKRNGRDLSDLDWAMQYVWDKITTTVCSSIMQYYEYSLTTAIPGCYWTENCNNWCGWFEDRRSAYPRDSAEERVLIRPYRYRQRVAR